MKALSVREPWLFIIVDGRKTIETRTWACKHRGDLLLVGSKKPKGPFSGRAGCVVELVDCRKMVPEDEEAACCAWMPDTYSWVFENVRPVKPIPIRGRLGIYELSDRWLFQKGLLPLPGMEVV